MDSDDGLVERRAEDGDERRKRVVATPADADLIACYEQAVAVTDEAILAPLSQTERDTLQALLTKIIAELPRPTR